MHRFSFKAIVAGVLILLVLLPAVAYGIWYAVSWWFQTQGQGEAQMAQAVTELLDGAGGTLLLLGFSAAMCIPGGYATARLARAHPYANSAVVAFVLTAISLGLGIGLGMGTAWDLWFDLANAVLTLAGCWLGAYLVARRRPAGG